MARSADPYTLPRHGTLRDDATKAAEGGEWLDVSAAAEWLGISQAAVRSQAKGGELRSEGKGRGLRVFVEANGG